MINPRTIRWITIVSGAVGIVIAFLEYWQVSIPFFLIAGIVSVVLTKFNIISFSYPIIVLLLLLFFVACFTIALYKARKRIAR